jgi:hypothetical protein
MSFDKKYELVEVLRDDGVKTFRARESATGRMVELHVLVGQPGKSEPPFDLLEKVRKLPPEQRTAIVETGEHMGTPYIVTLPITDAANFREWVAARAAAAPVPKAAAAYDPLLRVGHWKVPRASGESPTVTPMSLELHPPTPRTHKPPPLKPAETAPDITVVFNTAELMIGQQMKPAPAAPLSPPPPPAPQSADTSVFHAQTFTGSPAFPAPPAPPAPAPAPVSNDPAFEFTRMFETGQGKAAPSTEPPSTEPPASGSGEFTQMFQVPPAIGEKAVPPPASPVPPSMPPPAAGGPLPVTAAKKEPGEFTRMFQAPAAPASDTPSFSSAPPKPSPAAPPPPEAAPSTSGGPGEFTRMFRAQSTPAEPVAPAATPPPATPQPQPLSPGATASPDVTSLFQTGSTPVVSPLPTRKSGDKASDTAQFPAVSGTTPAPTPASTSGTASVPPAPPASASVGDFTSMFQTGQSPAPAGTSAPPLPQTQQSPVPAAPPPPAASAPGEFTSIFKTSGMPAATPQTKPAAGPASQAPGEFTNIFQTGSSAIPSLPPPPQQQPNKPSSASTTPPAAPPPPKPSQDPGEFTRIFAASPGQPIGEAGISAPPSKPQSPSPAAPSGFGAPSGGGGGQEPGEFTRVFSTPMVAPKSPLPMAGPPQGSFSDPNPFAAPSSPLPKPMVQPQPGNPSPFGQPQSPFGQSFPPLPQTPQMGLPQAGGMIPPRPFAAPAQPSIKDEYQQMFGGGDRSLPQQQQPMSPMGNSPGVPGGGGGGFGTATQSFQAFSGPQGQAPQAGGPSEYTRMFNAPSMAAPPAPAAQSVAAAAPKGLMAKKWPIFVFAGILLLLIIGAIIMFVLK